jgi:hypothetical protein
MTTQELIELAVHETKGLWPKNMTVHTSEKEVVLICIKDVEEWEVNDFVFGSTAYDREYFSLVCDRNIFEMTAKELGYIDGYRWGIRYNYNGVKPNIKEKVKIEWWDGFNSAQCHLYQLNWDGIKNFKIIDPAWKPRDTSYLTEDASTFKKIKEPKNKIYLIDLLKQLTSTDLESILLSEESIALEKQVRGLIDKREKEKQRTLLINKAYKIYSDEENSYNAFEKLYDLGYLVEPKE